MEALRLGTLSPHGTSKQSSIPKHILEQINLRGTTTLDEIEKSDIRKLPSCLNMTLSDWIDALTHPSTGQFPGGLSPRQMLHIATKQAAAYFVDHGVELSPPLIRNLHQALSYEVKTGRVIRKRFSYYVGISHMDTANDKQESVGVGVDLTVPNNTHQNSPTALHSHNSKPAEQVPAVENLTCSDSKIGKHILQDKIHQVQELNSVMNTVPVIKTRMDANSSKPLLCVICGKGFDQSNSLVLKCQGCVYQSHIECNYLGGNVPALLLVPESEAIINWRCYDCKFCRVCKRKDDVNDGLLLCDGCDTGEHMGCQNPPILDIPPAPWYCSRCTNQQRSQNMDADYGRPISSLSEAPPKLEQESMLTSSLSLSGSPPKLDERPFSASSFLEKNPILTDIESESVLKPVVTQEGPVIQLIDPETEAKSKSQSPQAYCEMGPSKEQEWFAILNSTTPPLSDVSGSSPDRNNGDQVQAEKIKPLKIKLGKRKSRWHTSDCSEEKVELGKPCEAKKKRSSREASVTAELPKHAMEKPLLPETAAPDAVECGQKNKGKERKESGSSTCQNGDLPSLSDALEAEVKGCKQWGSEQTAEFLGRMGHEEAAKAFRREDIDGEAMLLLQRHDMLHTLNVKLGPAVKAYHFINKIQSIMKTQ